MSTESSNDHTKEDLVLYEAQVKAWYESKMLHDRVLIQLSAAGIGLLVTLLTAFGVESCLQLVLFFGAFALFLATIWICLAIFRNNADYIRDVIQEREPKDEVLGQLDRWAIGCFTAALIASFAIGFVAADLNLSQRSSSCTVNSDRSASTPILQPDSSTIERQSESHVTDSAGVSTHEQSDENKNTPIDSLVLESDTNGLR